jgi:hypothetical protein
VHTNRETESKFSCAPIAALLQLAPVTVDCVDECSDPERNADEAEQREGFLD